MDTIQKKEEEERSNTKSNSNVGALPPGNTLFNPPSEQ